MMRRIGNMEAVLVTATVLALAAVAVPLVGAASAQTPDLVFSFTETDSMSLPGPGRVAGWTFMGPDTLVVLTDVPASESGSGDREVMMVFADRSGEVFFKEEFTGVLDRGLAWDGEFLYSAGDADDGSAIIYRLRADTLQVDEAYDAPGHRPTSMCFDGRYVWITDRDAGRIDRFDPQQEAITRSIQTPGFSPCGTSWDGRNVWVTDSGTGRLYRLSGSRLEWTATVDTESFFFRDADILLLNEGSTFWYLPPDGVVAKEFRFN